MEFRQVPTSFLALRAVVLAALLAMAGCGGGVWIGIGNDDDPEVALSASPGSAHAGDALHLEAVAVDDFGIDRVEFYRIEQSGSATHLCTDGSPPYRCDVTMPTSSAASVGFFARAVDGADQATDSSVVSVTVLP